MPKQFIKRILPKHEQVRRHKYLQVFGTLLHDPNLWHLNRRSASGAFGFGLFMAWVPVPFQMFLAAGTAIIARVNLPLSVALVWITNPVTVPPMFYFAYRVGAWLLGTPPRPFHFELSAEWLMGEMAVGWRPFLLGCLVMAVASGLAGFLAVRGLWRLRLVRQHQRRKQERAERECPPVGSRVRNIGGRRADGAAAAPRPEREEGAPPERMRRSGG